MFGIVQPDYWRCIAVSWLKATFLEATKHQGTLKIILVSLITALVWQTQFRSLLFNAFSAHLGICSFRAGFGLFGAVCFLSSHRSPAFSSSFLTCLTFFTSWFVTCQWLGRSLYLGGRVFVHICLVCYCSVLSEEVEGTLGTGYHGCGWSLSLKKVAKHADQQLCILFPLYFQQ